MRTFALQQSKTEVYTPHGELALMVDRAGLPLPKQRNLIKIRSIRGGYRCSVQELLLKIAE